jgi:hypothetical protein
MSVRVFPETIGLWVSELHGKDPPWMHWHHPHRLGPGGNKRAEEGKGVVILGQKHFQLLLLPPLNIGLQIFSLCTWACTKQLSMWLLDLQPQTEAASLVLLLWGFWLPWQLSSLQTAIVELYTSDHVSLINPTSYVFCWFCSSGKLNSLFAIGSGLLWTWTSPHETQDSGARPDWTLLWHWQWHLRPPCSHSEWLELTAIPESNSCQGRRKSPIDQVFC